LNSSEHFYTLTPQVIISAVEREGYRTTGLCWKLNSLENRVYDLELDDGSHIVVKFYRPGRWTERQINEEHEFLFDLESQEIPVCVPNRFMDGTTLKKIDNIFYAVWPRTGGRCVDEYSDEQIATVGRLLGRIHSVGKSKEAGSRLVLDSANLGLRPMQFLLDNKIIPSQFVDRYRSSVESICSIYDKHIAGVPFHRIHGDCHIGNLIYSKDGFSFLDFDDFYMGPAVQDFWMLANGINSGTKSQLEILIENYRLFCDFNNEWLDLIEPLRALRYINYAAWIAKRRDDPAFIDAFPHYGTDEYWSNETDDLEKTLYEIKTGIALGSKHETEQTTNDTDEKLTNKDLFWDWED